MITHPHPQVFLLDNGDGPRVMVMVMVMVMVLNSAYTGPLPRYL